MEGSMIWDMLRSGKEVGKNTPGHDLFNKALEDCANKRLKYNTTQLSSEERCSLLSEIIGSPVDANTKVAPPMHCDLGFNIKLGKNVLINYDCVLQDCCEISIGDNVLIGPGAKIVTASHPYDATKRRDWSVIGAPIKIENDVWIGAGAIILGGVTIGARSIVGAGSIVTKDVPSDVVVVGVPAKIIRYLT